jgi:guanylate kinase
VVVSGPSGAGKSTIVREALRRTGAEFSVSATTRKPRPGERDGCEYRFVSRERFRRMIDAGELLEWAEVFGDLYGTPAGPVREALTAGRTVILEVDVQGGMQVARSGQDAVFVLIVPPDMDELARRLRARGTEDEDVVNRRLEKATEEMRTAADSGAYHFRVVNDDLDRAVDKLVRIISQENIGE